MGWPLGAGVLGHGSSVTALLMLFRPSWLIRAEDRFRQISQHRTSCVWAVGGAVIAIRMMLLPLVPVPIPVLHG